MSSSHGSSGRSGGQEQLSLSQVPAHDLKAERAVLGSLMLLADSKPALRQLGRGLTADCFYRDEHGDVYTAILSLAKRQVGLDEVTICAEMERLGTKVVGTAALIDELHGWAPVAGNVQDYADIVIEAADWRKRQTKAYEILEAVHKRDNKAWTESTSAFAQDAPQKKSDNVFVLRTVNQDGEVVGEERHCPGCKDKEGQLKGMERDLRSWRTKCANLERDKEKEAQEDGMWQLAQRLFEFWKLETGHRRSPFSWERFYQCAPYLRRKEHGPMMIAKAIAGIAYNPYVSENKNGTKERHDGWDLLFRNPDKFERWTNRAPGDWKQRLPSSLKAVLESGGEQKKPEVSEGEKQLRVVG